MDLDQNGVQRRVAGRHDVRLDGLTDLLLRARGASVLDVGCNRGAVCLEMAANGAIEVHGCDNYDLGITVARELFADVRSVQSRFEVVDLTKGRQAFEAAFGSSRYDIVLLLATYHKIKRRMDARDLSLLVRELGGRAKRYFAWRGTEAQADDNEREIAALDEDLRAVGLRRVHTSYLSDLGPTVIWERPRADGLPV